MTFTGDAPAGSPPAASPSEPQPYVLVLDCDSRFCSNHGIWCLRSAGGMVLQYRHSATSLSDGALEQVEIPFSPISTITRSFDSTLGHPIAVNSKYIVYSSKGTCAASLVRLFDIVSSQRSRISITTTRRQDSRDRSVARREHSAGGWSRGRRTHCGHSCRSVRHTTASLRG